MCGVFGIFGNEEAAKLAYLGLYALQHRGEESAGIASYNGKKIHYKKGKGLVPDVFGPEQLDTLKGYIAVGHNRYSTTGSSITENIQPIMVNHEKTPVVIAHNGNFVNTCELYHNLEHKGAIFRTTMDSEVLVHLLARGRSRKKDFRENLAAALKKIKGAYSIVMMIGENLIGIRDPYGFKPLCLGKLFDNNLLQETYVLTSETCALDLIGAEYMRDVEPGEMVIINHNGVESIRFAAKKKKAALCIFEYIYFARPDGNIFGHNVYLTRKNLGRASASESPVACDFVMPIPDSGNYAAIGFSEKAKLPLELGVIRNHYIGRTFIQPSQFVRDFKVKIKLNPIKEVLRGKKIAIVEDSIVRGTTSKARVKTLRKVGVKEIHMRISCPPIKFPCFYGIDFPTKKELIAHNHTIEEIKKFIGVDSLAYLSLQGMLKSMPLEPENFCTACFTGNYPIKPPENLSKNILEEK